MKRALPAARKLRHERVPRGTCLAATIVMLALSGTVLAQSDWRPSRNVELIVQAGAGGASDRAARMLQKIIQDHKLVDAPLTVVNKAGGGGAMAYTYVNQHAADGHYLLMTSGTLITSNIVGRSLFRHSDFTPLAILCTEYSAFVVRADSPYKNGKALLTALVERPQDVRIALSPGLGNANHIAAGLAMKSVGGGDAVKRLRIAVFPSSAETLTALLGGHVDLAISPASPVLPHLAAETVRVVAMSSAQRLSGPLATAPTWRELGADAVYGNWRGVLGPKSLSEAQVAYWGNVFARLVATREWQDDLERNVLSPQFMNGEESRPFLDAEYKQLSALLKDIGLAK